MPIAQIEHINAVNNIEGILAVPGIASLLIGPNDLAGSMGHSGDPNHPDVQRAIDTVVAAARKKRIFVGMGVTDDPKSAESLIKKGVSWICIAPDFMLLLKAANQFVVAIRGYRAASN